MKPRAATDEGSAGGSRGDGLAGVVILGVGRSGTSAITRAFISAGFFAGREEALVGPDSGNPLGHFEPIPVLEANEALLERLGAHWWAHAPAPEAQLALRSAEAPRLRAVVDELLAAAEGAPIVVKEPRVSGLIPLWGAAVEDLLHPVLALRDPLEIARSHARRDGTSIPHALAAWEATTTTVLEWLDGRTATVAPYGLLLDDGALIRDVVAAAAAHLEPAYRERTNPAAAPEALRPDLRRAHADAGRHEEVMTAGQLALWRHVGSLPAGDVEIALPPELRGVSGAAREAMERESERFALRAERDALEEKVVALEGKAWKATEKAAAQAHRAEAADERAVEAERRLAEAKGRLASAERERAEEIGRIERSLSWRGQLTRRTLRSVELVSRVRSSAPPRRRLARCGTQLLTRDTRRRRR